MRQRGQRDVVAAHVQRAEAGQVRPDGLVGVVEVEHAVLVQVQLLQLLEGGEGGALHRPDPVVAQVEPPQLRQPPQQRVGDGGDLVPAQDQRPQLDEAAEEAVVQAGQLVPVEADLPQPLAAPEDALGQRLDPRPVDGEPLEPAAAPEDVLGERDVDLEGALEDERPQRRDPLEEAVDAERAVLAAARAAVQRPVEVLEPRLCLGSSTNDVTHEKKARERAVLNVALVLIGCGNGTVTRGRGSKNRKIMRTSFKYGPLFCFPK